MCGHAFPLEMAINDDAARRAFDMAGKMPAPLWESIVRYLALFRPRKRRLGWPRTAKLLNELLEPILAGKLKRHHRVWAAPIETWKAALEITLARFEQGADEDLKLPLKTHGYLFQVVVGMADRDEAAAERAREDRQRHRDHTETRPSPVRKMMDEQLRKIGVDPDGKRRSD
jgi:hypothetical protein